jgi:thioredoxin reductase (NADPH)
MTAALYARRAGKSVLVLEKEGIGGQIVFSPRIENFPSVPNISGSAYANALFEQVSSLGAEFDFRAVKSIQKKDGAFLAVTAKKEYETKSVILATGVKHRRLGIDREEELAGEGLSYCAVCDGAFFRDKTTAVVGGGNTALTDALYLSEISKKVFLIHRRDTFRAEQRLVEALKNRPNVEFILDSVVTALYGAPSLTAIGLKNQKNEAEQTLPLDGLFVAVGQEPFNQPFAALVDLDENGFIRAGENCRTSALGIFAAGDCRTKEIRQLTTAAADGAVAALAACKFLL